MASIRTEAGRSWGSALARARALAAALALAALVAAGLSGAPRGALAEWDEQDCVEADPLKLDKDPAYKSARLKMSAKLYVIQLPSLVMKKNQDVTLYLDKKLVDGAILDTLGIHEGDNIRVFGYLKPQGGRLSFLVMNIMKLPDDATLFRERIARLDKAGDMAGLYALGAEILVEGEANKKADAYAPIAREAYRAAIALKERDASARAGEPATWIALADDYLSYLGDRQGALERLVRAIPAGDPVPTPEVKKRLDELRATYYGGEYILFEEMKRREGFVERGGRWILRDRDDFERAIEAQQRNPVKIVPNLPSYYEQLAKAGTTTLGMSRAFVAIALGFPEDVDRIRAGNDVFDAWTFEGRGAYYFQNDQLFLQPDVPR